MEFVIEEADDLSEFQHAWKNIMSRYYWYKKNRIFDWNKDNELKDMERRFNEPESCYLIARMKESSDIVGILRISTGGRNAQLERWEPTVLDEQSHLHIAVALIEEAIEKARQREKLSVRCTIKVPSGTDYAHWHQELLNEMGFVDISGEMTELLLKLPNDSYVIPTFKDVVLSDANTHSAEDIARLTVDCFTGTEEDLRIHGSDQSVTNYEVALQRGRIIFANEEFHSPPEFWRFAEYEGIPIGVVGGLIPCRNADPLTGNLCLVGLLPAHRRRGITSMLIHSVLNSLIEHGCKYATVGTPTINYPAISMYEKLRFVDHSRLNWLVKSLN